MKYPLLRLAIFLVALAVPLYWFYLGWSLALGPEPGKWLLDHLGQGALILLLCTLSMTPLNRASGWPGWIVIRRQLGLWTFAYASLHLTAFVLFILGGNVSQFLKEVSERPYIVVGMLAFIGLLPLALTSNRWSMRSLGRHWKRLHRLIYPILLLALLHLLWVVRSDVHQWVLYASIGLMLLFLRTSWAERKVLRPFRRRGDAEKKITDNP